MYRRAATIKLFIVSKMQISCFWNVLSDRAGASTSIIRLLQDAWDSFAATAGYRLSKCGDRHWTIRTAMSRCPARRWTAEFVCNVVTYSEQPGEPFLINLSVVGFDRSAVPFHGRELLSTTSSLALLEKRIMENADVSLLSYKSVRLLVWWNKHATLQSLNRRQLAPRLYLNWEDRTDH